jgi:deazaflavin-dependent oxidoreductase (nitroreductase family)
MSDIKSKPIPDSSTGRVQEKPLLRRRIWKKIIDHILTPGVKFLYGSRLRRVIGGTMVLLTHVGRKTGKVRKTVLYAKNYDPTSREVMLVSAFGVTDWFLNISKQPALLVEIGDVQYAPKQKILTANEIADLERCFRRKHPVVARAQAWLMGWPWKCSDAEFLAFAASLRGVVFWPKASKPINKSTVVMEAKGNG